MSKLCKTCYFDVVCPRTARKSKILCAYYTPLNDDDDDVTSYQEDRLKIEYRDAWEEYAASFGNPSLFTY